MKQVATIFLVYLIGMFSSCTSADRTDEKKVKDDEEIYLRQIREDFIKHKADLATILDINRKIVARIDSMLHEQIINLDNASLTNGIMNTRAYDLSIAAYRNILNGNYIKDATLKLKIASHVARFEGFVVSKRSWDHQWDVTARPYLYDNGLLNYHDKRNNLISDPVFRSILFDRRMFAYDVERVTPRIEPSADSVIATIDSILRKRFS